MPTDDGWVTQADRDRAIGVLEDARSDLEEVRDITLAQLDDATVPGTPAKVTLLATHTGIQSALNNIEQLIMTLEGRQP